MKKFSLSPAAAVIVSLFGIAHAQTTSPILETVTVSASKGTQLEDMDVSTTVLTKTQIEQSPETGVDQILNKVAGIYIPNQPTTQLHPTGQVLNLRGFGTSTNGLVLVLIDGVPANDPYFRTVNWAQIPKGSIERIEIIRGGGATSLWGNMALGGVINIITHAPKPDEKSLQASYGSFNTTTLDAGAGYALNNEVTIGMSYGGSYSDGYNQTPDVYQNPNMVPTQSQVNNISAFLSYRPDTSSSYFAKLQASTTHESGLIWNVTNNQWETYRLTFGGQKKLTDKSSLNLSGWLMNGSMATQNASITGGTYTIGNPAVGTPYLSQSEKATYQSSGGNVFWQTEYADIKDIKLGLDLRSISVNDPVSIFNAAGSTTSSVTSSATHQFSGLFVQGTYRSLALPLDVTLGLREDFWQTSNASSVGNTFNNTLASQSSSNFDPRIGLKYYFNDHWDARAAAYQGFSAPGLNQMYRSFISGTSYSMPNTNLQPQTNAGYELGFDYKHQNLSFEFTAYSNQVTNYIDYARGIQTCNAGNNYCASYNTGVTAANQYVNAGNATLQGFEFIGNWNVSSALAISGGYSQTSAFLTSSYNQNIYPLNQQMGQIPVWMTTLGAAWKPVDQLMVTAQMKAFPDFWNTTNHLQVNQGAALLDMSVTYRYNKGVEIFGAAQNLGNVSYYDQGLTYTAAGAVNMASSSPPALGIPRTINIGIRAQF